MAEEGTLGLARAHDFDHDFNSEELSKEELQRRMDEARESITQTVSEIKDTVVHQYESVKETISDTLDWREQFKKRPVAWTAGAAGVGFLTGYCVTAMVKGDDSFNEAYADGYEQCKRDYEPVMRPSFGGAQSAPDEDSGPGFIARIQDTQAYDRLKNEASTIGGRLVDEVSKAAQDLLLPAAVGLIRTWLGGILPEKATAAAKPYQPWSPERARERPS
jgi:ElaB/YqjD/DUF883 family membrane-anchored ribosome-binding protein